MGYHQGLQQCVSDLIFRHAVSPAVVIGGAPSRLTDAHFWPEDAIFLSANDHGFGQKPCNYAVCCEDLEQRMRKYSVPVLCRHQWADYRIFDKSIPNSAALAAWAAYVMGCNPIIISGVECYQGNTYPHNKKLHTAGHNLTLKEQLQRWDRMSIECYGANFRVISGPLLEIFNKYDPKEYLDRLPARTYPEMLSLCQGSLVYMLQDHHYGRVTYTKGKEYELPEIEAHAFVRLNVARRA